MAITRGVSVKASVSPGADVTTTGTVTTSASGSLLLVGAVWQTTATPPVITDSKGNTWTLIGSVRQVGSFPSYCALWSAQNATGGSSHTFTATLTGGFTTVFAVEYLGVATSGALDQNTGAANDTTSPVTSGSVTTTTANQLLVGVHGNEPTANPVHTANNSFSIVLEETNASFWTGCFVERFVSSIGSYEVSIGVTSLTSGAAIIATFKESAAAGNIAWIRA